MSRVEAFATGIKIESSNQSPFWGPIKGSKTAKINGSRTHDCNMTFDPLKIKCSRAPEGNNQAIKHTFCSLDLGRKRKRLNRWHVSDYALVLHCNQLLVVGNRLAHKLGTSLSTVFNIKILTEPVGFFLHESSKIIAT